MNRFDQLVENFSRHCARRMSRRNVLRSLGAAMLGVAASPVLPVERRSATTDMPGVPDDALISGPEGDPESCDYWRNCGMDGFQCGCCGGSITSCPPGTEMAPVTWIGTCLNPGDGQQYVISYNDCCGKSSCNRCHCNRNEGDTPNYMPAKSNDIIWCMGTPDNIYHCTVTLVLGQASEG